jgi:AraC family transcriptional regulator of adaptative response/methylated-DNA-[protein]-cysteine methyltransferase
MAQFPRREEARLAPCIAFTIRDTALGFLLVAATERGVCHVRFGDGEAQLADALARELPAARLERDDARLAAWAGALVRAAAGDGDADRVPLDVAGSRFQRRVWDALRAIPHGRTLAYGEVAAALGAPRAARAVANACAANPVALAVPCHRVVPKHGGAGGYRWGTWRKRALLAGEARERAAPPAAQPTTPAVG